ncbi:DUF771 domain-containing protein [Alkalihalobacillus sp. NPDC078783]
MNQQLQVSLSIPIPEDSVLISKVELEELKEVQLLGVYWNMTDLENRIGKKKNWIKDNVLYPPKFKKVLDIENGGFVYYPKSQGQTWSFHANKMARFLDDNFNSIFK